jgi:transposase InsO family protein
MRFDRINAAAGIGHRLTKPNHPWTNGPVERMNRTIKDATVKRFHYDKHDPLGGISQIQSQPTPSPKDPRWARALRIHL